MIKRSAATALTSDNASETAQFMLDHDHRKTIDTSSAHLSRLARQIARQTSAAYRPGPLHPRPRGHGLYGAVDARVGLLWYDDALGRVAKQGVRVFALQTLFGGSYGLLNHKTYMPTPGYWAAVLHSRLMGTSVH